MRKIILFFALMLGFCATWLRAEEDGHVGMSQLPYTYSFTQDAYPFSANWYKYKGTNWSYDLSKMKCDQDPDSIEIKGFRPESHKMPLQSPIFDLEPGTYVLKVVYSQGTKSQEEDMFFGGSKCTENACNLTMRWGSNKNTDTSTWQKLEESKKFQSYNELEFRLDISEADTEMIFEIVSGYFLREGIGSVPNTSPEIWIHSFSLEAAASRDLDLKDFSIDMGNKKQMPYFFLSTTPFTAKVRNAGSENDEFRLKIKENGVEVSSTDWYSVEAQSEKELTFFVETGVYGGEHTFTAEIEYKNAEQADTDESNNKASATFKLSDGVLAMDDFNDQNPATLPYLGDGHVLSIGNVNVWMGTVFEVSTDCDLEKLVIPFAKMAESQDPLYRRDWMLNLEILRQSEDVMYHYTSQESSEEYDIYRWDTIFKENRKRKFDQGYWDTITIDKRLVPGKYFVGIAGLEGLGIGLCNDSSFTPYVEDEVYKMPIKNNTYLRLVPDNNIDKVLEYNTVGANDVYAYIEEDDYSRKFSIGAPIIRMLLKEDYLEEKNLIIDAIDTPYVENVYTKEEIIRVNIRNKGYGDISDAKLKFKLTSPSGVSAEKEVSFEIGSSRTKAVEAEFDMTERGEYRLDLEVSCDGDMGDEYDKSGTFTFNSVDLNPYVLDFEYANPWSTYDMGNGWVSLNFDSLYNYQLNTTGAPNWGGPFGFIVYNNDALYRGYASYWYPRNGLNFAMSPNSVPLSDASEEVLLSSCNDWLISPKLLMGDSISTMSFWARLNAGAKYEEFDIVVKEIKDGTEDREDTNDYVLVRHYGEEDNYINYTTWQEFIIDLSEYNNKEVFVALRKNGQTNGICLDDIKIDTINKYKEAIVASEALAENTEVAVSMTLSPNPVKDFSTVKCYGDRMNRVEVYSSLGKKVFDSGKIDQTSFVLNCQGYAPGMYMIKMYSASGKVLSTKLLRK